ncbi:MAG: ABC transporter substrate-binding protein, partial [Alphaproteobacteria bacterium]
MESRLASFRRLLLGLGLIAAAAAVLLSTDLHSRRGRRDATGPSGSGAGPGASREDGPKHLAILQHSTSQVMDDIREGLIEGLAASGWPAGPKLVVDVYNAHADLPTGNAIATRLASGEYDVVATISTPMLQAFANANREIHRKHVFMGVTAPVESGVGVVALDSLDKPAWMTGIGSAQPVEAIFREAKRLQPSLQTVGVAWNPAEVNSEVCTKRAREVSKALGMTLVEAPIESAKDVPEAAGSLVVRGAQAFWTGGDATIVPAIDALVAVANKAGIPVFSNMAGQVSHGTTFDLGANYREVGAEGGRLVARLLDGEDPATIAVRTYMPERLLLNEKAAATLRDKIPFDAATRTEADGIVGMDGTLVMRAKRPTPAPTQVAPPGGAAGVPSTGGSRARSGPGAQAAARAPLGGEPRRIAAVVYIETPKMEEGFAGLK